MIAITKSRIRVVIGERTPEGNRAHADRIARACEAIARRNGWATPHARPIGGEHRSSEAQARLLDEWGEDPTLPVVVPRDLVPTEQCGDDLNIQVLASTLVG